MCQKPCISNATDLRELFRSLHRDLHSFSIKSDSFKAEVHHSVTRPSSSRANQSEKCVSLIPLLPTPLWGFKLFPLKQKSLLLAGSESPLTSRSFKKNPGVVFITTLFVIEWAANFSDPVEPEWLRNPPDPQEANWKQAWDDAAAWDQGDMHHFCGVRNYFYFEHYSIYNFLTKYQILDKNCIVRL